MLYPSTIIVFSVFHLSCVSHVIATILLSSPCVRVMNIKYPINHEHKGCRHTHYSFHILFCAIILFASCINTRNSQSKNHALKSQPTVLLFGCLLALYGSTMHPCDFWTIFCAWCVSSLGQYENYGGFGSTWVDNTWSCRMGQNQRFDLKGF